MEKWLENALAHPDWVATQKSAWERWDRPESLGQAYPQFLQITEENLLQLPDLLAKHFRQRAQRHLAIAQALETVDRIT